MIYRLRRRFIRICTLSFVSIFIVLFASIALITTAQTAASLDTLASIIAANDGDFPDYDELSPDPAEPPAGITQESPFTTRYFFAHFDPDGELTSLDTSAIASISSAEASDLATAAYDNGDTRGWMDGYRYMAISDTNGTDLIFINGSAELTANRRYLLAAMGVFACGSLIVLFLVVLFSRRAVEPIAQAHEKQKQFITDSGHELKTPLTLIHTNLDILEDEHGPSEWLDDIRTETETMTQLVNRLVQLARMDELSTHPAATRFSLSDAAAEAADAFTPRIAQRGLRFQQTIAPNVSLTGDERAIRQLIAILLDNACKYCDPDGTITLTLSSGKHPILIVDNSYADASAVDTARLFDRFYRADRARTAGTGFGLGLSIAKATCDQHHAQINAHALDAASIRFRVRF